MKFSNQTLSRWSSAAIVESKIRFDQIAVLSLLWIYSTCCWITNEYHELSTRHTPLDYHLSVRFREMSVFYRESKDMTEQLKGPTSTLVPRAHFLFVTQFWQKLSRVGSGVRLLGSLSKGVFTWNRGDFAGASSIRFPLIALFLFKWYHHKMSCRRESLRREFTPVVMPGREFHFGTKSRNGIM